MLIVSDETNCFWVPSLPLLALGSVYVGHAKAVRYNLLGVGAHFWFLCFFLVDVCVDGINKYAGILQEAGNADSRTHFRSHV